MIAYKMILKVKDCSKVFAEGFDPGVLVIQEVEFKAAEEDLEKSTFIAELMHQEQEFIERNIEVIMERIDGS